MKKFLEGWMVEAGGRGVNLSVCLLFDLLIDVSWQAGCLTGWMIVGFSIDVHLKSIKLTCPLRSQVLSMSTYSPSLLCIPLASLFSLPAESFSNFSLAMLSNSLVRWRATCAQQQNSTHLSNYISCMYVCALQRVNSSCPIPHHTNCSSKPQDPCSINCFNLRYFEGSESFFFILYLLVKIDM